MSDLSDLRWASAAETARVIRDREVSAREVVDAAIERIERYNEPLTAFVYTAYDEARARADEADRITLSGADLPPLHGVPTAIKDLFDFKPGWPATFGGIPALADYTVPVSCVWAQRVERAGGIILGKTNSPVMGFRGTCDNPLFGPSRNPFDPDRNTGGSSGGSGAAVAAGLVPFAEGTDGGGSVRIPAAWCGLVGFKQSWGRVPTVMRPNAFAGTNPFVFEGIMSRTAQDAALVLSVLAGTDPADPFSADLPFTDLDAPGRGVVGMRIAYSPDFGGFPVEPGVARVVDEAVAALEEAGAVVERVDTRLPRDQFELGELWCRLIAPRNLESLVGLQAEGYDLLGEHRDQLPEPYLRFMDEAARTTVLDYAGHQRARTEVYDFIQSFFADHDLLVTPTLACGPVRNADNGETIGPSEVAGVRVDPCIGWCLTYPLNFTGHPAASVPAGMCDGLPVGLQIVGRQRADSDVLAACGALESARPWAYFRDHLAVERQPGRGSGSAK